MERLSHDGIRAHKKVRKQKHGPRRFLKNFDHKIDVHEKTITLYYIVCIKFENVMLIEMNYTIVF
jgi:hypothetical protein